MDDAPYPVELRRLPDEARLRITWSDDHVGDYPYDYLRGHCPCAACQGHGAGPVVFQPPPKPVTPSRIEPVGNYAVAFVWSDGHGSGIYRFDLLRSLCPCPVCRPTAPAP